MSGITSLNVNNFFSSGIDDQAVSIITNLQAQNAAQAEQLRELQEQLSASGLNRQAAYTALDKFVSYADYKTWDGVTEYLRGAGAAEGALSFLAETPQAEALKRALKATSSTERTAILRTLRDGLAVFVEG